MTDATNHDVETCGPGSFDFVDFCIDGRFYVACEFPGCRGGCEPGPPCKCKCHTEPATKGAMGLNKRPTIVFEEVVFHQAVCSDCGWRSKPSRMWVPRNKKNEPRVCPKCKSPYWSVATRAARRA